MIIKNQHDPRLAENFVQTNRLGAEAAFEPAIAQALYDWIIRRCPRPEFQEIEARLQSEMPGFVEEIETRLKTFPNYIRAGNVKGFVQDVKFENKYLRALAGAYMFYKHKFLLEQSEACAAKSVEKTRLVL